MLSPASTFRFSYFSSAPGDLLVEIATYLESRSDILSLCLISKSFFSEIAPVLYQSVVLNSAQQCTSTLAMLKRRKDIARHVRELTIRPRRSKKHASNYLEDSRTSSVAVAEIAASRCLDALSKFAWCHDEGAHHEEMWLALRMCCPQLRYLSTSIGSFFPSSSHLFNFTDLLGFSIYLTPRFYEHNTDIFLDEERPASKKLWDMLFKRCPNLEELVIEGYSSFPADARCLVDGRWPNLHKLSLGDISVDRTVVASPTTKCPFITFLEAHTELQSLGLSRHNIDPTQLISLDRDTLKLTEFSGTLPQVQALPHIYSSLKSLTFRDPFAQYLVHASLAVDSGSILRTLTSSCPHLQHLELACIRKTSFQLDTFAKALPTFRRLRSLKLTLVSTGDLSLAAGGSRIARANPRLQHFTLTHVPPSHPHALPRLAVYPFPRTARASAEFTLVCDTHGLPQALLAHEQRLTLWPWRFGATRHTRRYTVDLRPPGAPGRRKGGVRGVLGIILESSSAGEEMRMFMFCSLLVCLAGAFVANGGRR
ncbi:hypothetical protein B0H10DRAFT_2211745 [Mycena sp. CBHHK59/15]|nr:hypothetical protein B0H10DRAFT_2211745 [Mycena sp. CBHHK59/15]